jgi:hypothetical protein
LGRHTVTALLSTQSRTHQDWSADYRCYSRGRLDPQVLFNGVRDQVVQQLKPLEPLVSAWDDSIVRKRGWKIHGVAWRRDPLSPPFGVNFVPGQRVLQASVAVAQPNGAARMIPIDFVHAPTAKRPRKTASEQEQKSYREAARQANINAVALKRMQALRQGLAPQRALHIVVDNRFVNQTVLRQLPENTVLIGRMRKDAALFEPPAQQAATGRKRLYGAAAPTPEQLRQDQTIGWQTIKAFACDREHEFKIKHRGPVRTKLAGEHSVQVVVIAPLGYRLRKGSRLLYRQPAYLLCTDPKMDLAKLVQEYLWRWDIEVNFRDEKTLLGVGQAQVRTPESVQRVPALAVVAYAILLLAGQKTYGDKELPSSVPQPKWQMGHEPARPSTARLINELRYNLWAHELRSSSLMDFCAKSPTDKKPIKPNFNLASALFHAVG